MEKDNKYYTPSIKEFYIGFEYETLRGFQDGTVKSIENYIKEDLAGNWNKDIIESINHLPYVERSLCGKNAEKGLPGIRVKYLDKEDIESFGFEYFNRNMYNQLVYIRKSNLERFIYQYDLIELGDNKYYIRSGYGQTGQFAGTIKNKSELKVILTQIGFFNDKR